MSSNRDQLTERRDQALRDLVELDRQVEDGEIPADVADELRAGYEAKAAAALADLDATPEPAPEPAHARRSRGRVLAYAATGLAAVIAAAVLLPQSIGERPAGGFVTGNEVTDDARGVPPTRDLSTVTDAELKAVLEANPEVVGMRLALANRYTEKGEYDRAAGHYLTVLEQEPDNPEAQAHLGWLLLQVNRPHEALLLVDRALETDPAMLDALWFKANIQLYGMNDPGAALATLNVLQQRQDLAPEVRDQVEEFAATARQRKEADR